MPLDVEATRALADFHKGKAYLLTGTVESLAWYHENLLAALRRITDLERKNGELIAASGKQINMTGQSHHV